MQLAAQPVQLMDSYYRRFRRLNPPTFDGGSDPMIAEIWIRKMEKMYKLLQFSEEVKVRLAIFMLRGSAESWWTAMETAYEVNGMAWRDFKREAKDVKGIPDWWKPHMRETLERAEECFKTNYYGTRDVTEALIRLLRSSILGRIVNVSSNLGQLRVISIEKLKQDLSVAGIWIRGRPLCFPPTLSNVDGLTEERLVELLNLFIKDFKEGLVDAHGWPTVSSAYKPSKVLINAYTRILAKKYPALCINCVNPGFVKTDLNWNTGILSTKEGAEGPAMLALQTGAGPSGLFFDQTEVSTF
ncbi:(+)-neomenthol dehydrogenase-like [Phoenix dactylifera]|uniref:(+)-neomenthol dehydrogenase-like n=1 Tax=Phoenix dactylifera TaxID=42345 RepID=A0A8B9A0S6_PHODC|nr:(+)-neomenthol dehydrogenase-like [Phoenix dactylifera]